MIGDILRDGERIPGLGHAIYRTEDPRVGPILDAVRASAIDRRRLAVVEAVLEAAGEVLPLVRNVELATAALTWTSHMPRDAGELLFATARTAGWLAHALEEYGEHPMRLRGRALYVGRRRRRPAPDQPAPTRADAPAFPSAPLGHGGQPHLEDTGTLRGRRTRACVP